jgi:hypothetical protein
MAAMERSQRSSPITRVDRSIKTGAVLFGCLSLLACTSTQVDGDQTAEAETRGFRIGSTETAYAVDLPEDRAARAREYEVAPDVARLVERWMTETGRWGGTDIVRIEVDRFRLPAVDSRQITGPAKGNDNLGARVSVLREGSRLASFHAEHTLGAGDRSIAENTSADRAVENLVEAVAWSVAHELTPFEERREIFEIGKREQIERAIEMLELCGELSYAETVKYSALGKINIATASGAEARRFKRAFGGELERCY